MSRAIPTIITLAATGCSLTLNGDLIVEPPNRSVILVSELAHRDVEIVAVSMPRGGPLRVPLRGGQRGDDLRITALLYVEELSALGLSEGMITIAGGGELGRPLPEASSALEAVAEHGRLSAWRETAELSSMIATIRISVTSNRGCIEAGGCYSSTSLESDPCILPCPEGTRPGAPMPPEGVAVPAISQFPCPQAWRQVEPSGAIFVCDPRDERGSLGCADDEAHFIGTDRCTRIGTPCPAGDFHASLPPSPVLYVKAGALPGGSGSEAAPFSTIADAIGRASPGAVIAISKGRFAEEVEIPEGVALIGACVGGTVIASMTSTSASTVLTQAPNTAVMSMTVESGGFGVTARGSTASIDIEDVVVRNAGSAGVRLLDGANGTLRNIAIRGSQARGIWVTDGATAIVERAALENNRRFGVSLAGAGASIRLTDVSVRGTESDAGSLGYGLNVVGGASADAERSFFEGNRKVGVYAGDTATLLRLTDVVVRATRPKESDGLFGDGLEVVGGARADIHRVWLTSNHRIGALVEGTASALTSTDVVVSDTLSEESTGQLGRAISAKDGGSISIQRGALVRSREAAAIARGDLSSIALEDVIVRDAVPEDVPGGDSGAGLVASEGGLISASRVEISHIRGVGVFILSGVGRLFDVTVSDVTVPSVGVPGGIGIGIAGDLEASRIAIFDVATNGFTIESGTSTISDVIVTSALGGGLVINAPVNGANVTADRIWFERTGTGVVVQGREAHAMLRDATFQGTGVGDCVGCGGLCAGNGAFVSLERALFENVRAAAVYAFLENTLVDLKDVTIRDTAAADECTAIEPTAMLPPSPGFGVAGIDGARISIERFSIERSALSAVAIQARGVSVSTPEIDLFDGTIEDNPVGASIAVEAYDLRRLGQRVLYRQNQRTISVSIDFVDL